MEPPVQAKSCFLWGISWIFASVPTTPHDAQYVRFSVQCCFVIESLLNESPSSTERRNLSAGLEPREPFVYTPQN